MKKKIALSLALLLVLLTLAVGCGASHANDPRIGSYIAYAPDGERIAYELTLYKNGEGEIVHYPVIGGEEREEIIFDFEGDDTVVIHGTAVTGGVLGRTEYIGKVTLMEGAYDIELSSADTGVPFAHFVR